VQKNPIFTNLKEIFEHTELPAKLLYYFYEVIKATSINQVSRTFISLVVRVIEDPVGIQVWHAESMKRWRFTRFFKLG